MLLHLGGGIVIFQDQVVGVFSTNPRIVKLSHEFIDLAEWQKRIVTICGKGKSLVVTTDTVYVSPVSVTTMLRRCNSNYFSNDSRRLSNGQKH